MKKFNLKDKKLISDIELHDQEITALFPLTERIQNATVALFECKNGKRPDLIATGVIFRIMNHFFLFTAAHVYYEEKSQTCTLAIALKSEPIFKIYGNEWFTSLPVKHSNHEDDPIDASVCHFLSDIPTELKEKALTLDDIDYGYNYYSDTIFISGYPTSQLSIKSADCSNANGTSFNTSECIKSYETYHINKNTHLTAVYNKSAVLNFREKIMPKPIGLSGGSMSRIIIDDATKEKKAVLSAIVIAYKPEKANNHGCIIGSKIQYHISSIKEYIPELQLVIDSSCVL